MEAIGSSHTAREVPAVTLGCPSVSATPNASLRSLTTAPDTDRAHKSHGFSMMFIDLPLISIGFSLISLQNHRKIIDFQHILKYELEYKADFQIDLEES